jgi:hypothetical protein
VLERRKRHATANARQAAAFLDVVRLGRIRRPFLVATTAGVFVPAALVGLASLGSMAPAAPELLAAAGIVAIAGLYLYEHAFVRAGQLPPLS